MFAVATAAAAARAGAGGGGGGARESVDRDVEIRSGMHSATERLLDRHVFNDVEQCSTTALFTARADGRSASPAPLDFCKACLWQVIDASIDLRDPNPN